MTSGDKVKQAILKYLYDFDKEKARWTTANKVALSLKRQGFSKPELQRNIYFLIREHYIDKKTERVKSPGTSGGSIAFEKIRISPLGVQLFEKSKFGRKPFSAITLQGTNNVLVMGDNLGVITQTKGASIADLNILVEKTKNSDLTEEEKMNLIGDIETIKSQLVKPSPSKKVIKATWLAIKAAASFSGAHDLLLKIKGHLAAWIG